MRLVVGITGATGAILGIRALEALQGLDVETHLCLSKWGQRTIEFETDYSLEQVRGLASTVHPHGDQSAAIASGSFAHDGMIIIPCSVRTLAAVAHGLCDNLISRAADVTLKERRPLVMVVREAPLSSIHIDNMARVTAAGAVVAPPVPAFYSRPQSIDDVVSHIVARSLDQLGVDVGYRSRWKGGWDQGSGNPGSPA